MSDKLPLYKQHGTYNCYRGPLRCRCDLCVQAHIDWQRRRNGQEPWLRQEIACQICERQFLPKSSTNVLCGDAKCAAEYQRQKSKRKHAKKAALLWQPRPCKTCGKMFNPDRESNVKVPKRCDACVQSDPTGKKVKPTERKCYTCRRTFSATGHFAYCQDVCALVGKKIRERIRLQKRREQGKCGLHGVEGFCDKCHLTNFRKVQVRKRAYTGETSSAVEMARAQKWKCSLCDGRLDTKYVWPHAMSLTVDHTIPRSLGGTDDPANLTAAHLICNTKKNNRTLGPEQLRLVG